jgi:hypothetical protein
MQQGATELLRRLRPDNFAAFAELFTAAVLQARNTHLCCLETCLPVAAATAAACWLAVPTF